MHAGKRYSFFQTAFWSKKYILLFIIYDSIVVLGYHFIVHNSPELNWLKIPWQPISLIGIAVAFYLGFKNNSSYERLWEARKIWGGIVNASRSFTVMARDFINNDMTKEDLESGELISIRKRIVYRHIAWLHALAIELRKLKKWEHADKSADDLRKKLGIKYDEGQFDKIKPYLSPDDFKYVMSKGNRSSHLISAQSKDLMKLRQDGVIEHFRHLEMQNLLTEFYTLQGKSERIKNFPFPRQYAAVNYFFVVIFILLLPFGMMDVFAAESSDHIMFMAIPFAVLGSWVFWMMEMIGDYSENPFEGLFNDVPITSMAVGIEIDIRQMLDETDLPEAIQPTKDMELLV